MPSAGPFLNVAVDRRWLQGGVGTPAFKVFSDLCCRAYNAIRRHRTLMITLFRLMLSTGIPELQREADRALPAGLYA